MYEEYVYLKISKSTDGGATWTGIFTSNADSSNFIAPFVVSPSNGNILYAGAKKLFKSTNGGANWFATNSNTVLNGANISCLDVSYTSPETLIAATGQRTTPIFEIFCSTNGGTTWTKSASAIPNRYPTDIAFDPSNSKIAFATFSGYGTSHVFKSTDAGKTWNDISANLPDLPTQSVCVDPVDGSAIYVGTDLGVYRTLDGGKIWEPWFDGMPVAMIIDLSISRVDRRLRAATFGNGVYQRKLPALVLAERSTVPLEYSLSQNFPNPFNPSTTISYSIPAGTDGHSFQNVTLRVHDVSGKEIATLVNEQQKAGIYSVKFNASKLSSGVYFYTLHSGKFSETKKLVLMK